MSPSGAASNPPDSDTLGWGAPQADASASSLDLSGAVLGDFRVERLLGRGGMGEVYLARQLSLDRPVALKVLRPDLLTNPTNLARFEAEAGTAARLNHPNIVHVYAVGGVGQTRYIAMEYVPGSTLRDYMNRKGSPELRLAYSIMRQAGLAIEAAGEVGLVHRDVKPENLLLTRKGLVKVADFGLCRDQGGPRPGVTQPGVTMGTPLYMSPEQVQGRPLDHRSDLYSLGVTFYHMLAGVPPFRSEASLALALKHVHEEPVSLAVHRPELPPELVQLVMKLLAKKPADRYQTATEMLRDLSRAREAAHSLLGPSTAAANSADEAGTPRSGTFGLRLSNGSLATPAGSGTASAVASAPAPALARAPSRKVRAAVAIASATLAGLALGVAAAWLTRAEDLLSDAAPAPSGPPGLWMASTLGRIPRRADAEHQYRYAQLEAPPADREAAWLAVPWRFPDDHRWTFRAYTQLARHLFRREDRDRLNVLAAELARSDHPDEKDLAAVIRAAAAALEGDGDRVREQLEHIPQALGAKHPALTELALEVATRAMRPGPGRADFDSGLNNLLLELSRALRVDPRDFQATAKPG